VESFYGNRLNRLLYTLLIAFQIENLQCGEDLKASKADLKALTLTAISKNCFASVSPNILSSSVS
jgi:hypothetical protein